MKFFSAKIIFCKDNTFRGVVQFLQFRHKILYNFDIYFAAISTIYLLYYRHFRLKMLEYNVFFIIFAAIKPNFYG